MRVAACSHCCLDDLWQEMSQYFLREEERGCLVELQAQFRQGSSPAAWRIAFDVDLGEGCLGLQPGLLPCLSFPLVVTLIEGAVSCSSQEKASAYVADGVMEAMNASNAVSLIFCGMIPPMVLLLVSNGAWERQVCV